MYGSINVPQVVATIIGMAIFMSGIENDEFDTHIAKTRMVRQMSPMSPFVKILSNFQQETVIITKNYRSNFTTFSRNRETSVPTFSLFSAPSSSGMGPRTVV